MAKPMYADHPVPPMLGFPSEKIYPARGGEKSSPATVPFYYCEPGSNLRCFLFVPIPAWAHEGPYMLHIYHTPDWSLDAHDQFSRRDFDAEFIRLEPIMAAALIHHYAAHPEELRNLEASVSNGGNDGRNETLLQEGEGDQGHGRLRAG